MLSLMTFGAGFLMRPSERSCCIRKTIKAALGMSAADLIRNLNPKIRGWANYHRHVVSTRTFACVDHHIFSSLWRWSRRRHPNKTTRWCKQKYFASHRGRDWSFFGETCDDEGQPGQIWLRHARTTSIRRHVKVKGDANPYDPAYGKSTSNNAKESICRKRFGVLVRFAFSGMNNAGSALCATPKSLGSRV